MIREGFDFTRLRPLKDMENRELKMLKQLILEKKDWSGFINNKIVKKNL